MPQLAIVFKCNMQFLIFIMTLIGIGATWGKRQHSKQKKKTGKIIV